MFKLEDVIQLKPEEKIRLVTKRHAVTIFPRLLIAFLLIVVPFFFLFPLFKSGPTGVVAFLVCVGVGIFVALRTFAVWDGDTFIVSSARVVCVSQPGIFSRTVTEAGVEHLTDFSWGKRGIAGTVFNFGDITMNTAGQQKIVALKLPAPQAVHALLVEVVDLARTSRAAAESAHQSHVERVQKLIEDLDETSLSALEHTIKKEDRQAALDLIFPAPAPPATPSQPSDTIAVKRFDAEDAGGLADASPSTDSSHDDAIKVKRFDAGDEDTLIIIPDPDSGADADSGPDLDLDPVADSDPDSDSILDLEQDPDPYSGLDPSLDPDLDPDPDTRTDTATDTATDLGTNSDLYPDPTP